MADEQTPEYNEALRLQLQRDRERFEKAGLTEDVAKVDARLAELPAEQVPAETVVVEADTGTGAYEDRTVAQLRATADKKGVDLSGATSKDDIIAALREG